MTIKRLIGTLPSQISRNRDLGTAAFQDLSQFYTIGMQPTFRNRIINGDMRIDQRYNGSVFTPVSAGAQYTVDRWSQQSTQAGKFSIQRSTDAPAGFTNSLLITSTSSYTVASNDYFAIAQIIEGNNLADLDFGLSTAHPVTLSFWVKSSLIGTFGASIQNGSENRCYSFNYTINVANAWTYITKTIPGDSTGTWNKDNTAGMYVWFGLGATGSRVGAPDVWTSGNNLQPTDSMSVVGTSGATLQITGVQLEKGTSATLFEFRSYSTELALCQRYLPVIAVAQNSYAPIFMGMNDSTSSGYVAARLPVEARANPTGFSTDSGLIYFSTAGGGIATGTVVFWVGTTSWIGLKVTGGSGLAAGNAQMPQVSATTTKIFCTGCEL